jgi:molybdenum cofactor cytidylyltransferase
LVRAAAEALIVMPETLVTAVVPAAGQSTRFGGRKLVADVGGVPLLDRTLASLLDGGIDRVIVVVQAGATFAGVARFADPRVSTVVNPDPDRGMFSSIQIGLAVADGDVVVVLPADMPFVAPATVAAVVAQARRASSLVVAVHAGKRGHPIAFPRAVRDGLLRLDPGSTLKAGLAATSPLLLAVADPGVLRDVDVRDDLARDAQESPL